MSRALSVLEPDLKMPLSAFRTHTASADPVAAVILILERNASGRGSLNRRTGTLHHTSNKGLAAGRTNSRGADCPTFTRHPFASRALGCCAPCVLAGAQAASVRPQLRVKARPLLRTTSRTAWEGPPGTLNSVVVSTLDRSVSSLRLAVTFSCTSSLAHPQAELPWQEVRNVSVGTIVDNLSWRLEGTRGSEAWVEKEKVLARISLRYTEHVPQQAETRYSSETSLDHPKLIQGSDGFVLATPRHLVKVSKVGEPHVTGSNTGSCPLRVHPPPDPHDTASSSESRRGSGKGEDDDSHDETKAFWAVMLEEVVFTVAVVDSKSVRKQDKTVDVQVWRSTFPPHPLALVSSIVSDSTNTYYSLTSSPDTLLQRARARARETDSMLQTKPVVHPIGERKAGDDAVARALRVALPRQRQCRVREPRPGDGANEHYWKPQTPIPEGRRGMVGLKEGLKSLQATSPLSPCPSAS
ncbi:hypothetical protein G7046_g1888 [Stylonectria norvegica]|nr:hypothetical protein G7046_g1888 [Stylonectria norvegica]